MCEVLFIFHFFDMWNTSFLLSVLMFRRRSNDTVMEIEVAVTA
jgi:hypothetical protein